MSGVLTRFEKSFVLLLVGAGPEDKAKGLVFKVQGLRYSVLGSRLRLEGFGFRVED